ncbi:hypothetical protein BK263_25045 [Escherichia coli]|nr:hypothetical protein BK263_25045 [Escherichia coli]
MLHRSESLLTLWQHHSLGILWCNTKTGLSRNNRQCYGKSYRTEPQNISVPEMHKNTVHMFLKRGMLLALVLCLGPTVLLLKSFVENTGGYLSELVSTKAVSRSTGRYGVATRPPSIHGRGP